jgi:hypothetical protein
MPQEDDSYELVDNPLHAMSSSESGEVRSESGEVRSPPPSPPHIPSGPLVHPAVGFTADMFLALMKQLESQSQATSSLANASNRSDKVSIAKFKPGGEIFPQHFVRNCELAFTTQEEDGKVMTDKKKILFAINNLENMAHNWAMNWYRNTDEVLHTWVIFRVAFLEFYVPRDDVVKAQNALGQLEVGPHYKSLEAGVENMIQEFNNLVIRLPHLTNEFLSPTFVTRLPYALQKEVTVRIGEWRLTQPFAQGQPNDKLQPPYILVQQWAKELCQRVQTSWRDSHKHTTNTATINSQRNRNQRFGQKRYREEEQVTNTPAVSSGNMQRSSTSLPQAIREQCLKEQLCFRCKKTVNDNHKRNGYCPREFNSQISTASVNAVHSTNY